MGKSIAQVIKDIRESRNLTQKEFAKKLHVADKTISSFERGIKMPNPEFLDKMASVFNELLDCPFDYLPANKEESNPENLIVVSKKGKRAIFDKSNSTYLTAHLYDKIFINKYGYHYAYNVKKVTKEGGNPQKKYVVMGDCFLIDNYGNTRHSQGLDYGWEGKFDFFGCCPAHITGDKGSILADFYGNKLSKRHSEICPVKLSDLDNSLALYVAIDDEDYTILDRNGENNLELRLINNKSLVLIEKNFDHLLKYIEKYGPNILEFFYQDSCGKYIYGGDIYYSQDFVFNKISKYVDIMNAVDRYIQNNLDKFNKYIKWNILSINSMLIYTVEKLQKFVKASDRDIFGDINTLQNCILQIGDKYLKGETDKALLKSAVKSLNELIGDKNGTGYSDFEF